MLEVISVLIFSEMSKANPQHPNTDTTDKSGKGFESHQAVIPVSGLAIGNE